MIIGAQGEQLRHTDCQLIQVSFFKLDNDL